MSKRISVAFCPCGSGAAYVDCCGPYIDGTRPAPTAEALMRSRYTAHAIGNEPYLLHTWHASTRPPSLDLDPRVQWIRLKLLASAEERVEFVATCRVQGRAQRLHENSRFLFENGRWLYVGGTTE